MTPARTVGHSQKGFTIIEMAVTMAIFGFLLAAAMPSIGVWMDNIRIRNVAESIQNGLQAARAEAVRRNQPVTLWLVSLDNPSTMSDSCDMSSLSGSWVVSVNAPNGRCGSAPSATESPMIVTSHAVGSAGPMVSVNALQSDGVTAATAVTFNGFGRMVDKDPLGNTPIAQVDITGLIPGTEYRFLSIRISPSGMVRMCDPRVTDATDPRICTITAP